MERSTVSPPTPESKTAILGLPSLPADTSAMPPDPSGAREFSAGALIASPVSMMGLLRGCDQINLEVLVPHVRPFLANVGSSTGVDGPSPHLPYQLVHRSYIIDALQVGVSGQRLALLAVHQKLYLGHLRECGGQSLHQGGD